MKAQEFDQRFDEGEDINPFIEMSSIRHSRVESRRVNVDFSEWMIEKRDWQFRLIGVNRWAHVNLRGFEQIQQEHPIEKAFAQVLGSSARHFRYDS